MNGELLKELELLREIARRSNNFCQDVLPQIGVLCVQDFENLNLLMIALRENRRRNGETE